MANASEIQSLVADFVQQLSSILRRAAWEQVSAALGEGPGPQRRAPQRTPAVAPRAVAPKRGGGKRTKEDMEAFGAALLAHVEAHPGQRGEQIAAALGTDVGTMRLPMKALIQARKIRTEGQRRGMTYFVSGRAGGGSVKATDSASAAKTGRKVQRGRGKKRGG